MAKNTEEEHLTKNRREQGQSIVLVTFMMIGLIAFVGIAVDVGFLFARRSQLSKAVDAAALAAVTEVEKISELTAADRKAGQFLGANLPLSTVLTDTLPDLGVLHFQSDAWEDDDLGSFNYTITATWPVEQYFLKVIGRDFTRITASATAAYFPTTDIYASRRVEDGALASSNQAVFGPEICSRFGDPFSPFTPNWAESYLDSPNEYTGLHAYNYRILIPPDYPHDIIRVELFDPDSINRLNESATVTHTLPAINLGEPETETLSCSASDINPCIIDTGERRLGLPADDVNSWWFIRIDENREAPCGNYGYYNPEGNTQTQYDLYYLAQQNDGTIISIPLAQYIGQVGDNVRDTGNHQTDMRWVSPGGRPAFDRPAAVAAAWPGVDVPATPGIGIETFEVSLSTDLANILVDGETGNRYLYLDVTAISGASENGFEIWAGPPDYVDTVPGEVNARNVHIINNPGSHSSSGLTVFGQSNLPMNSNVGIDSDCDSADRLLIPPAPECNAVDIPLLYVPPEFAGGTILVSLFDSDSGSQPPVTFYFDSIAEVDWSMRFAASSDANNDPDAAYWAVQGITDITGRCRLGSCQNVWVNPPYAIPIPILDPDLCQADPGNQNVCTPFVGGRLVTRYIGGKDDTYGWMIRLQGLPFLVR